MKWTGGGGGWSYFLVGADFGFGSKDDNETNTM